MIEGYNKAHEWLEGFGAAAGKERGDTTKAAQKLIHLVGDPSFKKLPSRFALGDDSIELIDGYLVKRKEELHEWKEFGSNTSFP